MLDMHTWIARLYDENGEQRGGDIAFGAGGYEGSVAAPAEGGWLAYADPTTLVAHDLRDGHVLAELPLPSVLWWKLAAPPDASVLYAFNQRSGQTLRVDPATWTMTPDPLPPGEAAIGAFDADGSRLVTVSLEGVITIRDGRTLAPLRTLIGEAEVGNSWSGGVAAFTADGRYVLTAFDRVGRLWDIDSGRQVGGPFPNDPEFVSAAFQTTTGAWFVTGIGPHALIWDLDPRHWFETACRAAGRNLTRAEWDQFGPSDAPYRATCPQWPAAA